MTLNRKQDFNYEIWCDMLGCQEIVNVGNNNFTENWEKARSQGWRKITNFPKEVTHLCPACAKVREVKEG